jgi:hypothetical protein
MPGGAYTANMQPTVTPSPDHTPAGKFRANNNAWRTKKLAIASLVRDIAKEFEGGLSAMRPSDRVILERIAVLMLSRPKSNWDYVRTTNSANRLLGSMRKRLAPRRFKARAPSMASLLTTRAPEPGD